MFVCFRADILGLRFLPFFLIAQSNFEGKHENWTLKLFAEKIYVAVEFHHDLFGYVQPHLICIKKV